MRKSTVVLLFLFVGCFVHMAMVYPLLPPTIPTHFGAGGEPDGWSSREGAMVIYGSMVLLMTVVFGAIGLWLPRLPTSLINLPNKDYWLAPERREATLREFTSLMEWFGAVTLFFLMGVMHLTFRVGLGEADSLGPWFWVLLVGYMALAFALAPWLLWRFRRPAGV